MTDTTAPPWVSTDVAALLARTAHHPGGHDHDQSTHGGAPVGGAKLPAGYKLMRSAQEAELHVSVDGESGPGAYLTDDPAVAEGYAKAKQDYAPNARMRTYETTRPLVMVDRGTPEGEAVFRDLQRDPVTHHRLKGAEGVARFKKAGFDGVVYPGATGTEREVVIHDPSVLALTAAVVAHLGDHHEQLHHGNRYAWTKRELADVLARARTPAPPSPEPALEPPWTPDELELFLSRTAHTPGGHDHGHPPQSNHGRKGGGGLGADGIPSERGPDAMTPERLAAWGPVIDYNWGAPPGSSSAERMADEVKDALHPVPVWTQIPEANVTAAARRFIPEAVKGAPVVIRISEERFAGVVAEGRIKSQFETSTSAGNYTPRGRARTEALVLGFDPSRPDAERPIYGYVGSDRTAGNNSALPYGNFAFDLTPEARARSTVTFGDSLGQGYKSMKITDAEEGKFTDADVSQVGTLNYHVAANIFDKTGGRVQPEAAFRYPEYIEAQVFGGVDVGRDVAKIHYDINPSWSSTRTPDLVAAARRDLAKTGKPWSIRQYNSETDGFDVVEEGGP